MQSSAVKAVAIFVAVFVVVTGGIVLSRKNARPTPVQTTAEAVQDPMARADDGIEPPVAAPARDAVSPSNAEPDPTPSVDPARGPRPSEGQPADRDRRTAVVDESDAPQALGSLLGEVLKTGDDIIKGALEDTESAILPPPPTSRRADVGARINAMILRDTRRSMQRRMAARVERLGDRVVEATKDLLGEEFSGLDYTFTLLQAQEVNAFAHAGGYVYVNTGLLDVLENDGQLTFVLAHEVGHVEECHTCGGLHAADIAERLLGTDGGAIGQMLYQTLAMNYSTAKELEADAFGHRIARELGVDVADMRRVFEILDGLGPPAREPDPDDVVAIIDHAVQDHFRSHPDGSERIEQLDELERRRRGG